MYFRLIYTNRIIIDMSLKRSNIIISLQNLNNINYDNFAKQEPKLFNLIRKI